MEGHPAAIRMHLASTTQRAALDDLWQAQDLVARGTPTDRGLMKQFTSPPHWKLTLVSYFV